MQLRKKLRHLIRCAGRLLVEPGELSRDLAPAIVTGNNSADDRRANAAQVHLNAKNKPAIFVWIPKSAGTSIFTALELQGAQKLLSTDEVSRYFKQRGIVTFGHLYLPLLVEAGLVSRQFVKDAFKFAIVRNPFDRIISLFEYLKRIGSLPKTTTFRVLCSYLEEKAWEPAGSINHDGLSQLNPQVAWITNLTGTRLVDEIYRYEELTRLWPEICRRLGVASSTSLGLLNKSPRKTYEHYFNGRCVEIVRETYNEDFEQLGYSKEPIW